MKRLRFVLLAAGGYRVRPDCHRYAELCLAYLWQFTVAIRSDPVASIVQSPNLSPSARAGFPRFRASSPCVSPGCSDPEGIIGKYDTIIHARRAIGELPRLWYNVPHDVHGPQIRSII